MKIALVVTDLSDVRIGGISRVATDVGRNLVSLGHEVTAYVLERPGSGTEQPLHGIARRCVAPFRTINPDYPVMEFSRRAYDLLMQDQRAAPFDVVHAFNLNGIALPRHVRELRRGGTLSVVSSFETIMMDVRAKATECRSSPSLKTAAQIALEFYLAKVHERRYLGCADAVFTEDMNTHAALRDMGSPAESIHVIPSGVDVEQARAARAARLELPWSDAGGPLIGYVGRVDPRKGVQYLIEAMPAVRRRHPGARLVLVGGSRHGYDQVVRRLIEEQGLRDAVHLTGRVEGDILPYYKCFDLIVIPSLSEGIPITLGEAMAAEVPVVITRLPGVVPFVKPGDLVHWADIGDPGSLGDAIVRALDDPQRQERVNGAARFIADYTWHGVAERHAGAYEALRADLYRSREVH